MKKNISSNMVKAMAIGLSVAMGASTAISGVTGNIVAVNAETKVAGKTEIGDVKQHTIQNGDLAAAEAIENNSKIIANGMIFKVTEIVDVGQGQSGNFTGGKVTLIGFDTTQEVISVSAEANGTSIPYEGEIVRGNLTVTGNSSTTHTFTFDNIGDGANTLKKFTLNNTGFTANTGETIAGGTTINATKLSENLGEVVTIADNAFGAELTIKDLDLSNATNLTSIGKNAFKGATFNWTDNKGIVLKNNATLTINDGAFQGATIGAEIVTKLTGNTTPDILDFSQATGEITIGSKSNLENGAFQSAIINGNVKLGAKAKTTVNKGAFASPNPLKGQPAGEKTTINGDLIIAATTGAIEIGDAGNATGAFEDIIISGDVNLSSITGTDIMLQQNTFKDAIVGNLDLTKAENLTIVENVFNNITVNGDLKLKTIAASIPNGTFNGATLGGIDLTEVSTKIPDNAFKGAKLGKVGAKEATITLPNAGINAAITHGSTDIFPRTFSNAETINLVYAGTTEPTYAFRQTGIFANLLSSVVANKATNINFYIDKITNITSDKISANIFGSIPAGKTVRVYVANGQETNAETIFTGDSFTVINSTGSTKVQGIEVGSDKRTITLTFDPTVTGTVDKNDFTITDTPAITVSNANLIGNKVILTLDQEITADTQLTYTNTNDTLKVGTTPVAGFAAQEIAAPVLENTKYTKSADVETVVLTFNETLNDKTGLTAEDFVIKTATAERTGIQDAITAVKVLDKTITLTVDTTKLSDGDYTVELAQGKTIQDANSNISTILDTTNNKFTIDTTAPTLTTEKITANEGENEITITFDEKLDTTKLPVTDVDNEANTKGFWLTETDKITGVLGTPIDVTTVTYNANALTLNLETGKTIAKDKTYTLHYKGDVDKFVADLIGNKLVDNETGVPINVTTKPVLATEKPVTGVKGENTIKVKFDSAIKEDTVNATGFTITAATKQGQKTTVAPNIIVSGATLGTDGQTIILELTETTTSKAGTPHILNDDFTYTLSYANGTIEGTNGLKASDITGKEVDVIIDITAPTLNKIIVAARDITTSGENKTDEIKLTLSIDENESDLQSTNLSATDFVLEQKDKNDKYTKVDEIKNVTLNTNEKNVTVTLNNGTKLNGTFRLKYVGDSIKNTVGLSLESNIATDDIALSMDIKKGNRVFKTEGVAITSVVDADTTTYLGQPDDVTTLGDGKVAVAGITNEDMDLLGKTEPTRVVSTNLVALVTSTQTPTFDKLAIIEKDALRGNTNIEKVNLPYVTTIKENAFAETKKLKEVKLPKAKTVEAYAFAKAPLLETAEIGTKTEGKVTFAPNSFAEAGKDTEKVITVTTNDNEESKKSITTVKQENEKITAQAQGTGESSTIVGEAGNPTGNTGDASGMKPQQSEDEKPNDNPTSSSGGNGGGYGNNNYKPSEDDKNSDTEESTVGEEITKDLSLDAITLPAIAGESKVFSDVAPTHWASSYIDKLSKAGIINGIENGSFNPAGNAKRADVAIMISKLLGVESTSLNSFNDVDPNAYYAEAVAALKEFGVVNGSNGDFNPQSKISRQDTMIMIGQVLKGLDLDVNTDTSALDQFSDKANIGAWATEYVSILVNSGIVSGSNGKINPKADITRAEIATIISKVYDLIETEISSQPVIEEEVATDEETTSTEESTEETTSTETTEA